MDLKIQSLYVKVQFGYKCTIKPLKTFGWYAGFFFFTKSVTLRDGTESLKGMRFKMKPDIFINP